MGTRHLIGVVKDNQIKLSQYSQWDGYFHNGNGEEVARWVRENLYSKDDRTYSYYISRFKENIDLLEPVDNNYIEACFKATQKCSDYDLDYKAPSKLVTPTSIMFPQFSRDTSYRILEIVYTLRSFCFRNDKENNRVDKFPVRIDTDTSWIEFTYIIDLDTESVYFLTSHDFKGEPLNDKLPQVVQDTYGDLDCFYISKIRELPPIGELKKQIKRLKID